MRHIFTIIVDAKRDLVPDDKTRIDGLILGYVSELSRLEPALVGARVLSATVVHDVTLAPEPDGGYVSELSRPEPDGAPAKLNGTGPFIRPDLPADPFPAVLTIEAYGRRRRFEVREVEDVG